MRTSAMSNAQERIEKIISENPVVLFMKGTPEFPQCGFSSQVVQILEYVGAPIASVNVLEDAEIRQGVKEYANWPTIPQLYIKGEFVGGCDIVREMFQSGELASVLTDAGVPLKAPAGACRLATAPAPYGRPPHFRSARIACASAERVEMLRRRFAHKLCRQALPRRL